MDKAFAIEFRRRFEAAYNESGYKSYRALSIDSGWSDARVGRIVKGQFDDSEDGPGFFGVVRACQRLGVTPNYLAGINNWTQSDSSTELNAVNFLMSVEQKHSPPSIEALLSIYMRSGARLEAFDRYREYYDLYDVPDLQARRVKAIHVGANSLSAMRMGAASHLILQEAYEKAPTPFQERIFTAHQRAFQAGMTVEIDAIDERMENRPVHVKIDYSRVAMKLSDANGRAYILICCQLIPQ